MFWLQHVSRQSVQYGHLNLFSLMSHLFVMLYAHKPAAGLKVHVCYYLSSERLTVPGRGRLSNQRCAGRTHWASCYSRTPSWQASGGWTQRSSGPPQRAAYQACTRPESTARNKTLTLWLTSAKRKMFYLIRRITWPTACSNIKILWAAFQKMLYWCT